MLASINYYNSLLSKTHIMKNIRKQVLLSLSIDSYYKFLIKPSECIRIDLGRSKPTDRHMQLQFLKDPLLIKIQHCFYIPPRNRPSLPLC